MVPTPTTFGELVNLLLDFFELLIPVVFAILFLYIVWKILDAWVINATDESKRAEGRQVALIGVVGMIVMLIAWGLVNIIRATFLG